MLQQYFFVTERYYTASKECPGLLHTDAKGNGGGLEEEKGLIHRAAKTKRTNKQC